MALGMDRETGKPIESVEHLRQSIRDILSTRIGERVMLRRYGSNLPRLVDEPMNRSTLAAIRADIVNALGVWEPRLEVEQVVLTAASAGSVTFDITLVYLPDGRPIALRGVTI